MIRDCTAPAIHCRIVSESTTPAVPDWLHRTGAVAWRVLVIGAVVYFGFQALRPVGAVLLSMVIALFFTSMLWSMVAGLKRRGWHPMLATWTVIVGVSVLATGVGMVLIPALVDGIGPLVDDLATAYEDLQVWLVEGPLGLSEAEVAQYADQLVEQLQASLPNLATGILTGAAKAIEVVTGFILALIVTFFLLKDGDRLLTRFIDRLPADESERVATGGVVAWMTLKRYVRGLVIVGLVDAVGIGIGLLIVGVPLVLPLSILVFIGAFFPVIGAFVSGLLAVAVALVNGGIADALIILAIIVAVQQLESNVIHPIVFGRTMQLHPIVILLAIAIGGFAFGLVGIFLAVPITAVVVAVNLALSDEPDRSPFALAKNLR